MWSSDACGGGCGLVAGLLFGRLCVWSGPCLVERGDAGVLVEPAGDPSEEARDLAVHAICCIGGSTRGKVLLRSFCEVDKDEGTIRRPMRMGQQPRSQVLDDLHGPSERV